jgi:YtcA family
VNLVEHIAVGRCGATGIARAVCGRLPIIVAGVPLYGCEHVPSINLLGAFFPSWMLCVLVGVALTLVGRRVLAAAGVEPWVGPRGVVYPALALAFTLATWLAFFQG